MPDRNSTSAPAAASAAEADAGQSSKSGPNPSPNRSPRAQPLPEVEWAEEVTPPEERLDFFPDRPRPRIVLAYPNAKRHLGR
jgi:hypothetical protein